MPIPLGILAAAGVRAAGGSYELIETITVGSGGAASVTFSNLNTYSSTYQHLQIRALMKSTAGTDFNIYWAEFNGDTAANYSQHNLFTDALSNPVSNATPNASRMFAGYGAGVAAGFGAMVMDILDPFETTKNKTIRSFYGSPNQYNLLGLTSGNWRNTNAVTSIKLYANSGNLAQYSRFSIYGLKAS